MKAIVKITSALFLFMLLLSYSSVMGVNNKKDVNDMRKIRFIPESFNGLELGYYQTQMNECSPGYPNKILPVNTIAINTPQKIICYQESFVVIPVCVSYSVSSRRGLKYYDLSAKMLYIKNSDEEIFTGEIIDKTDYGMQPLTPPNYEDQQQRKQQMIQEAQEYGDDELGDGFAGANYLNINLMQYIDIPFLPGKYEVWLSFSGLESNHAFVEIIAE